MATNRERAGAVKAEPSLVSVVIPNHNYGQWLAGCIESLAGQSYERLEVILVDDGSTDGSPRIIAQLRRRFSERFERFCVILNEKNRGKVAALNRAIPEVGGRITLTVDADDWLAPQFVTHTLRALRDARDGKTGFVYTDCWLVDAGGEILARGRARPFDAGLLSVQSYIPTCAPGLSEIFAQALPFDESIGAGCKHHVWKKVVGAGWKGLYLPEPLFYYRMHDRNLSGIGRKILSEVRQGALTSPILSGYWPTSD